MIYRFYNGAPNFTVDHVKQILERIGNVTEFEVFRNQEDSPYISVVDDETQRYTFILKDDKENEFWFWTLCGYGGSGPQATKEILQVLGLKDEYHISSEGNNYIHQTNLVPKHDLNLLVSTRDEFFAKPVHRYVVKTTFKYAYQRFETKQALESLAYFNCILKSNQTAFERNYFSDSDYGEVEWCDYATNNEITFGPDFKGFTTSQLKRIIEKVVEHNRGKIEFYSI